MVGLLTLYGEKFLNTQNAGETHVLGNLNGICTPRGDHFAARAHIEALELLCFELLRVAIEPAQFLSLLLIGLMIDLGGNDVVLGSLEEKNHNLYGFKIRYCNLLQR